MMIDRQSRQTLTRDGRSHAWGGRRSGAISVFLLISLPVLLAFLALAIDLSNLWQAKVELRNAADSAALAAARELVDDELLTGRPGVMLELIARARRAAIAYGQANPVLGKPLPLDANPDNRPDGDLLFGVMDNPRGLFGLADRLDDPAGDQAASVNAVRVVAQRTRQRGNPAGMHFGRLFNLPSADVVATASAMLDRDVIGFRPLSKQPMPFAPIGILSDPTMTHPAAWETQVVRPLLGSALLGEDRLAYDRRGKRFLRVPEESQIGDGIFEMKLRMPLSGQAISAEELAQACGCLVWLGAPDWEVFARQVEAGVTAQDLGPLGGQLVLGENNLLPLPGLRQAPPLRSQELAYLVQALQNLQQGCEPRIWPVYGTWTASGEWEQEMVVVQGFVAARVGAVELEALGKDEKDQRLQLCVTLQPCMMATGLAITDSKRRNANPAADIHNRYVCKVRLVE